MEGKKPKAWRVGRLGRAALLLGVATATAGTMLLGATAANAAVGKFPGAVSLSPASGATSLSPTWATTQGCASGFQGSAVFKIVESNGSTFSISAGTNSVAAPFSGTLTNADSITTIAALPPGVPNGGTVELVVYCFSGASQTGTSDPEMSTFLTISSDGLSYTTSSSAPATSTTTTLSTSNASPDTCTSVTLTATEVAADTTHPAGNVQFEVGGTAFASPVAVNASGVATLTTTFTSTGTFSVTAVFSPTSSSFTGSTSSAVTETVTAGTSCNNGSEPMSVQVPTSGTFTLTVPTGTVTLTVNGATATGSLNAITVSDTRNTFPGWSVSGQSSDFIGSGSAAGSSISGNQLGWVPNGTVATGATLGPTVTPGSPGLGSTAAILALAHAATPGAGFGTSTLSAALTLNIAPSVKAGPYAATMTITAVTALP